MGIWRTLHPRGILYASGDINVHGGVSPNDSRTLAHQSGAEFSADKATMTHDVNVFVYYLMLYFRMLRVRKRMNYRQMSLNPCYTWLRSQINYFGSDLKTIMKILIYGFCTHLRTSYITQKNIFFSNSYSWKFVIRNAMLRTLIPH